MITNSIIAGNTASVGSDIYNEPAANYNNYAYNSLTYGGSNIVQNTYDPDSGISGSTPINGAPLLAALGNYGGPTQTMPPLPGSARHWCGRRGCATPSAPTSAAIRARKTG